MGIMEKKKETIYCKWVRRGSMDSGSGKPHSGDLGQSWEFQLEVVI